MIHALSNTPPCSSCVYSPSQPKPIMRPFFSPPFKSVQKPMQAQLLRGVEALKVAAAANAILNPPGVAFDPIPELDLYDEGNTKTPDIEEIPAASVMQTANDEEEEPLFEFDEPYLNSRKSSEAAK